MATSYEGLRERLGSVLPATIAVAVTTLVLLMAGHFEPGRTPDPLGYGLLTIAGLSLAFYRRWPVAVLLTILVAHFSYVAADYPDGVEFVPILAALLLVTQEGKWRWTVGAAGISALMLIGADITDGDGLQGDTLPAVIGMTTVLLLGLWLRTRSQLVAEARDRAEQAERTKEEEARRRVDEERLRIARDVHDTVAHLIATINVQAGSAVHVLDKRPEQAREALVAIKQASAEAMRDLRTTLGMLRNVDEASRSPSPRLAQLPDLVTMARDAGLETQVDVSGEERDLPSSVDLAAYRILQESLTNVIRHANASRVTLSLTYAPNRLELRVVDDGRGANSQGENSAGTGIQGMRERAALLGGRLSAGPRAEGGFSVHAELPHEVTK
ncbi:MAG: sensor histidine kinase [Actinomycetota bacterium]